MVGIAIGNMLGQKYAVQQKVAYYYCSKSNFDSFKHEMLVPLGKSAKIID